MVSWALRPLGLGRTHSSAPPSRSSWRPWAAFGSANACRYAVRPSTATTLGSQRRTAASSAAAPAAQLVEAQLLGTRACRRDDVGDADPESQDQFAICFAHAIADVDQMWSDACCVQGGPEAVAAAGEVGVDGSGPQSRVDTDEQQSDAIIDEVVDRCAVKRDKLGASELHLIAVLATRRRPARGCDVGVGAVR